MAKSAKVPPTTAQTEDLNTLVLTDQGLAIILAGLKCLIDNEGHLMTTDENNAVLDMADQLKKSLNERI